MDVCVREREFESGYVLSLYVFVYFLCLFSSTSLFSAVFVRVSGDKTIKRFHKVKPF